MYLDRRLVCGGVELWMDAAEGGLTTDAEALEDGQDKIGGSTGKRLEFVVVVSVKTCT
jgi:hypothetical protein